MKATKKRRISRKSTYFLFDVLMRQSVSFVGILPYLTFDAVKISRVGTSIFSLSNTIEH